jgi:butyrate kinase
MNPGSTSTKTAVFEGDKLVFAKTVEHQGPEMAKFKKMFDQFQFRLELIKETLTEAGYPLDSFQAVVARGGRLKGMPGGTYGISALMLKDLRETVHGEHASDLGAFLAIDIAKARGIPAFIVDPITTDEVDPVARISGLPELERGVRGHFLNMRAVARQVAAGLGKPYEEARLIVAHLGSGVSLSVHRDGRVVDIVDGQEEGPFSPDRCGSLPTNKLVNLCFSGKFNGEEMRARIFGGGGLYAYLGTKDVREVQKMAQEGNEQAALLLQALAYQVAKSIGALATVLNGNVDAIAITGGMAYSPVFTEMIMERVAFIAPVTLAPGEKEMEALAAGALRVLRGEEEMKQYA